MLLHQYRRTIISTAMAVSGLLLLILIVPGLRGAGEEEISMPDITVEVFSVEKKGLIRVPRIERSEEEWRRILTPEQYDVIRRAGTECAFTGALYRHKGEGIYRCVGCGIDLFLSKDKFESGTGWPSFFQPVSRKNVEMKTDRSHHMVRVEVLCARCGAHLGHIFDDGPPPAGKRYCINSAALRFIEL